MKIEAIEPVLHEILKDIEILKALKEKESGLLEDLIGRTKSFDDKLSNMKVTALPSDLAPVKQQITEGIEGVSKVIAAQPKTITREFHFHLFPKLNIKDYYRTYSKLVVYLTIFLLATGLVSIGLKWIEGYNRKQLQPPQNHIVETYLETFHRPENKKSKFRPIYLNDTLNQKPPLIVKSPGQSLLNKKMLMDSLKNEIQKYLFRHPADSANK